MAAETKTRRLGPHGHARSPASGATLVTIRPGRDGSEPPLLCVHARAGDVSLYSALARRLPPDRPVLGLIAPPAGELRSGTGLEELAQLHVREIRRAQPGGPYLIAGECTGGALAYEIARQLEADGQRVALLALIDAYAPGQPRLRTAVPRPAQRILHRARILGFHLANLVRLPMRAKLEYAAEKAARAARALRRKIGLGGLGGRGASAGAGAQRAALAHAFAAYRPEPCACPTVLLRASRLPLGIVTERDLGWGDLATDLQVEIVPGYFTTLISEPGVRALACALSARLADACGKSPR